MLSRDAPIQRKLMTMVLATSGVVLLLTCAAFIGYEFATYRQASVQQLSTLGEIIAAESTVLIGFSQGGTVALEAIKQLPGLAGAVVAYSARFAQLPLAGASISARVHLVHGEYDAIVSRVHSERAARVLAAMHTPVTLDIVAGLGHALSHHAVSLGSLRLLQGIYEGRKATLH